MNIIISNRSDDPIYTQIEQQIKAAIISGQLKEGDMLPSMRVLAKELRISMITTKRAYEELEKEGLIRSVVGKGFYVCEYNMDFLREKQLMMLEQRLTEVIQDAKNAGLAKNELLEMVEALYEV